ncbi:MAG: hypothetical protein J5999_11650 [Oscillospiraceae bacterium]|nr:hypothetical protein [Oscillospiraceae bacterium]
MKLSQRDKVIFLAVVAFLTILLGGVLFVKPKYEEMKSTEVTLEEKRNEKTATDDKIGTLESKKEELKKAVKDVEEIQEMFIPHLETFEVEPFLFEIISESDIEITASEYELMTASELKNYVYQKNAVAYPMRMDADLNGELPQEVVDAYNQVKVSAPAGVKVGLTTAKISFRGPFEDIEAALDNFASQDKTVIVTGLEGKSSDAKEANAGEAEEKGPEGILTVYVFHIEHMAEVKD